ncbi:MAG: 50S ribosome-binding GTPase [Deltaproteobacteria bacterium]|jgi:sulfate adenylyltransferase large subunit|nr:50S ribosome-binding GTPase [Deltaproteobacteria bacterium]
MSRQKEVLKLVVAGHVDHGKSTIVGRLLHDTGALPQGAVDKVKRIAKETGKPFEFAYLLDAFEEEQKQGITIDMTELQFHTKLRDYVIIDAPGHKEFLKNMISGAAGAEAAFLVVDASRGVEEQSRRHAYMLSLLGISQVCVLVNKMDLVDYAQAVFTAIQEEMTRFAASIGLSIQSYIPLAALPGENILYGSKYLPWYNGATLIQALDGLGKSASLDAAPLRLPVQDVYKFDDRRILAGRVESGSLKAGDEILISPGGKKTRIAALANWPESLNKQQAVAGESIGIMLTDEFFNQRGEVISRIETAPATTSSFRASLFWLGKNTLRKGNRYKLKIATQEAEAEIAELISIVDASSLTVAQDSAEVHLNDVAEVIIKSRVPMVVDRFSACQATGRFVLIDGYDVAGGGIVTALEAAEAEFTGFIYKDLRARCELFEEFCYNVTNLNINKYKKISKNFTVGDVVPLTGKSYTYPEFFDVVINRDKVVVKIRAGKIATILPLVDYVYEGLPIVNGRGFTFKVTSRADWQKCQADYAACLPDREEDFLTRWLEFTTYRSIPFAGDDWQI